MKLFQFLCFITFISMGTFACNDDDCSDGYISMDGDCICPDDKFEGFGECRSLRANELYGINSCSIFTDTTFIEFLEKKDGFYTFRQYMNGAFREHGVEYIEFAEYDSLYDSHYGDSGFYGQRFIEGVGDCSAQLFGRLTAERFDGHIEWRNAYNGDLVERCPFTLGR